MLGPLGHIGAALAYAARKGSRQRADHASVEDVAWARSARADDLPAGVELEWLGTSGFRIGYDGADLLIDPYLTRHPLGAVVRRQVVAPSWEAIRDRVPRATAILIGHTHFDHAMDAPVIARALGCPVYGSASMATLMRLHGVAEHGVPARAGAGPATKESGAPKASAVIVDAHRTYQIGPFAVTFVPSRHSKLALGMWTPADGEVTCEHLDELTPQRYRCGQVWGIHVAVAGTTFYHQGSCDLIDDEVRLRGVDYLLAGIAGRRFTRRYVERLLRAVQPRVIVPHHWDDFFRPLDAPVGFSLNVNLSGFLDEVVAVSRDFDLRTLVPLAPVRGPSPP